MYDAKKRPAKNSPKPGPPSAAEPSAAKDGPSLAFQLATQWKAPSQTLQRKTAADGVDAGGSTPEAGGGESGLAGSGAPLDPSTRAFFESRFSHDFGSVRVHTGRLADRAARALNATAYTLGDNVVFRDGLYSPSTLEGRRLLAHELAHVVQQKATGSAATPDAYVVGERDSPQEQVADAVAARAVSDPLGSRPPNDLAALALSAGSPASSHAHVLQRGDGDPPMAYPLVISAATFGEAAQKFAEILKAAVPDEKARVIIVNGANIRVFDETGAAVPGGSFRLNGPASVPVGVFRQVGGEQSLKVIMQNPDGSYGIGGVAKTGNANFSKDVDRQEDFSAMLVGFRTYYVAPQTTATPAQADAPEPPEELPEFMKFTSKDKANLPAWPAAVLPLSPQVATVHSQGTFMMKVEKNQGINTLDRVTNIMQRTHFRWEVLRLDPELKVKETKKATQLDAAREGYKRRLRDLEADRKTLLGEHPEKQSLPKSIVRGYFAEQMTNQRTILAMAGQTVMTAVNIFSTGSSNLSQEDIIQIPWKETGDYFVRCLATPESDPEDKYRRATSVGGLTVSVFDIEEVARTALPTPEDEKTRTDKEFELATKKAEELGKMLEEGAGDTAQLDLDYNLALIRVDYLKELQKAPSDPLAANVAELNMINAELSYFYKKFPRTNKELNQRVDETAAKLRTRKKELEGLVKRADSKLGAEATRTATMPARLVDEMTGSVINLTFSIGERTYIAAGKLEVHIADITSEKGRVFSGSGSGIDDTARRDAWLLAMRDLRQNLGRGRGYLSYRVPSPYDGYDLDLPNPMQLQMAVGDQIKEMVDDTANAMTLVALVAAPFTGGASLGILAVLAPVGAASSLYNVVNRAMYDDLHLDDEAVLDFINIASLGLGKVGEVKKASKAVQMIATSSRIAVRLGDAGQYFLMTYRTYEEIMKEQPGESPDAARRRKLLALLNFIQGASIPVSAHLLSEANFKPTQQPTPGQPHPPGGAATDGLATKPKTDAPPADVPAKPAGDATPTPESTKPPAGAEKKPGVEGTPGVEQVKPADAAAAGKKEAVPVPKDAEGKPLPRAADQQLSLMTGPLRDKVYVDSRLGPKDVLVRYETKGGVVSDVHIAVGVDATAADIHAHKRTAEYIQRYSGFTGRARILLDQIRNWFREPGRKTPEFGTRAWELRLELEKLRGMINDRTIEIDKIVKEGRKPIDESRLQELHAEIDNLEGQMKGYATELGAMSADPALGYVAARGLSAGAVVARQLNYPDPPEGYVWRASGTDIHPMWVGKKKTGGAAKEEPKAGGRKPAEGETMVEDWNKVQEAIRNGEPPILTWDETAKKFKVKDKSGKEVPFEKNTTREEAFRMLGGEDPDSALFAFVEMLKKQGLMKTEADFIKQMQEPAGLTPRTVRDNAKEVFRQQLIQKITDKKLLAQTETYKSLIKEGKTPQEAHRMASHEQMLAVTRDLASADRGSIGERWYAALYGSGDAKTQVSITVKVPDESGVLVEQQRNIDRMEGTTARELKNVTGAMGKREQGQIEALIAALGETVKVNGVDRKVERVVETFIDPRGAAANADFMQQVFEKFPKADITFELYTTRGAVIEVNAANYKTILDSGLKARLGLPEK